MDVKQKSYENTANSIIKEFKKRGIEGFYCPTSKEAVELAMSMMEPHSVIASGGSQTLEESGMMQAIRESEHTYLDRLKAATPEEKREIYAKSVMADYYFMSANAVTLDGELVNIDGNGNRVACLITGPKEVIVMVGMNKIVTDTGEGINRVRNVAAPPNGVRLNLNTPCSLIGKCANCLSEQTMCAQIVITRRSKPDGRIKVILIGETLGY